MAIVFMKADFDQSKSYKSHLHCARNTHSHNPMNRATAKPEGKLQL